MFAIHLTYSWGKKTPVKLNEYKIDVIFQKALTIFRCNPYEQHVIRDITIEKLGSLKCSNRMSFLPDNHIESVTLLEWNSTTVACNKNVIKKEKTHLNIKHKPKNAFKGLKFRVTRLGSSGESNVEFDDKKSYVSFEHHGGQATATNPNSLNDNLTTTYYTFHDRPILCRERYPASRNPCLTTTQKKNFTYMCYYRMGYEDPPTVADFDRELKTLTVNNGSDEDSINEVYMNKKPLPEESFWSSPAGVPICIIVVITIIIIVSVSSYFLCCRSSPRKRRIRQRRDHSDTSIASNTS
ncbi:unnamed protein product [Adineta ricciae]|uniref:Uncharacterized protein n=1 Tax=Adineta ricciae TaxID=249248 RepID=A0A814XT16_ADIRI|nr:unnamed protein product [Adineta ricciae]